MFQVKPKVWISVQNLLIVTEARQNNLQAHVVFAGQYVTLGMMTPIRKKQQQGGGTAG